jgi:hypothetical protein
MTLMLPVLAPDMTLYSLLALTHRMNGFSIAKDLSSTLFSNPNAALRHDFPSNLGKFCYNTGQAFGDVVEVANNHSVLPYFLRFRSDQIRSKALDLMSGPTVEPLKFVLGLPAGPTGSSMPLHYCQDCLLEDVSAFGYAYWHRAHQLPSVVLCPVHLSPLCISKIRLDGRGRSELFLPEDKAVQDSSTLCVVGAETSILRRQSLHSTMALNNELSTQFCANSLRSTYLHGLKQQGLLTKAGNVRAQELTYRLNKQYASLSTLEPFKKIVGINFTESLMRLVRKPRGHYHTACHLILIDFLFGDWDLFNSVYLWERQMDLPFDPPYKSEQADPKILDQNLEERLRALTDSYNNNEGSFTALANKYGVDVNTAMRWSGKLGLVAIKRKPKFVKDEIHEKVIKLLAEGQPLGTIASITNLSKSTIDRICNSNPLILGLWRNANQVMKRLNARAQFQKYISDNPSISLTHLRKTYASGYLWLYKNDFQWLSKNSPIRIISKQKQNTIPKPRINWDKRDEECLLALKKVDLSDMESWERMKPKAMLRRLPALSFTPRLDQLPKCRAWVDEKLQTHLRKFDSE